MWHHVIFSYLKGSTLRWSSVHVCSLSGCHLKLNPQVKPPLFRPTQVYSKVFWLMISMTGTTASVGLSFNLVNTGTSQLAFTSQWLSRKVNTSPVAWRAPSNRALINPSRRVDLTTVTMGRWSAMYWSSGSLRSSVDAIKQSFDIQLTAYQSN